MSTKDTPISGLSDAIQSSMPSTRREFLKRAALLGVSVPAFGALLAACADDDDEPAAPAPDPTDDDDDDAPIDTDDDDDDEPAAPDDDRYGGEMVVTAHIEVPNLSHDFQLTVQYSVITQIYNAVVEMDENFEFIPVLAEDYEVSDDGLAYTFNLRQGVLFHDGEEFTSEDVQYTYDWMTDPENGAIRALELAPVESVDTPDDYTAVVNLRGPSPAFINRGAVTFIVPAHYHAEVGEDTARNEPIGTGAFRVREFRPAEFTIVEAFDDHFRGRPYLDSIRLNVIPEASVRAIALETGEADGVVWPLLVQDSLRFADDPDTYNVYRTSPTSLNHFPLNNERPQLAEVEVRRAMLHAIDRQAIIDDVFAGAAVVAHSNLSPALEQYFEEDVRQYDYDPDAAAEMLDEAGWEVGADGVREKDGTRLSFTCTVVTGDQDRRPQAEVVQQYLADVGIEMLLAEAPIASIQEGLRTGELEASVLDWTYGGTNGDPDPSPNLRSDARNNFNSYNNPRVDELIDMGQVELDEDRRREIYSEIQQIVAEDVPMLFMMYRDFFNVFTWRIGGMPESALFGPAIIRKANEFYIAE